ncbi:SMP-30/gluconolactonase/LRE family protein [Sphingobium cupriresistens]|uniref:Calcium-binding protein n=1 Tax=Sphingobium cupriresistens LL01 TaxID=1420583 RepID=A0A0J7XMT7_9SPHN|nr:SMP-30/gluconolactonase/LRE family protein [Sphingobium cupriresistens]KMS52982.1 calcium-binding protein [Sphingobium cupriresistens LL01]
MEIRTIESFRCKLGEGPVWDVQEQALYGTDLLSRSIWRYDPQQDTRQSWTFADYTGSFALRERGGAIVALSSGLYLYDFSTGAQQLIADVCGHDDQLQLNDGKVDQQGRFVVGSVHTSGTEAEAAWYGVAGNLSIATLARQWVVTNGPCWSPDGGTFYAADSMRGDIFAYDYDTADGRMSNPRIFAHTLPMGGIPDGATVDAQGFLWTAICGGSKVVRYAPNGEIALTIDMPTPLVSSVMFGGPDLDRLFVTSIDGEAAAREIPAAAQSPVASDRHSGALFVIDGLGIRGLAERRFVG